MRIEYLLIILGMAVVTFLTRFGSQLLFRQMGMPAWFDRWLKHVPTGILTALIVPSLLLPKGYLDLSVHNHYLLAGFLSAAVAFRFRSVALTMGVGLATVVVLRIIA